MPTKGLLWPRSDRDRRKTFDPYDQSRHSDQVRRSHDDAQVWSESLAQRAASMDGPHTHQERAGKSTKLHDDTGANGAQLTRTLTPDSRPTSSRLARLKFRQHASDT